MMQVVKATGALSDRHYSLLQSTIVFKFLAVIFFTHMADHRRNHKFIIATNLSITSFALLFFAFAKFIEWEIMRRICVVLAFTTYFTFMGGTFSLLDTLTYNIIFHIGKPMSYYGKIRLGGTIGNMFIHALLLCVQEGWSSFFKSTYKENKNNINIFAGVLFGLLGAISCLFLPKYVVIDEIPIEKEYLNHKQSKHNESTSNEKKQLPDSDHLVSEHERHTDCDHPQLTNNTIQANHFKDVSDTDNFSSVQKNNSKIDNLDGRNHKRNESHLNGMDQTKGSNTRGMDNPIDNHSQSQTKSSTKKTASSEMAIQDSDDRLNMREETESHTKKDLHKEKKRTGRFDVFVTFRSVCSPLLIFYCISVALQGLDRVALSSFLTYYLEVRKLQRSFLHFIFLIRYIPEIMVYSFSVYVEKFVGIDMMFAIAVFLSTVRTFFYAFEEFAFQEDNFALLLLVLMEITKGFYASFLNYSGLRIFRLLFTNKTASIGQGLFTALYNALSYMLCSPIGYLLIADDPALRKQNFKLLFRVVGVASLISLFTPIYAMFNKKWTKRKHYQ